MDTSRVLKTLVFGVRENSLCRRITWELFSALSLQKPVWDMSIV